MAIMSNAPAQVAPISDGATARRVTKWKLIVALASSDILALVVGWLGLVFAPGFFSSSDADFHLFLVLVWLIAVAGIVVSEVKWGRAVRHRILFGAGAAAALGLFLCWYSWWLDRILDKALK
jgi:hypothetical protein